MEDANSAYKDLKQRINVEETKRKEVESKKNEMAKLFYTRRFIDVLQ